MTPLTSKSSYRSIILSRHPTHSILRAKNKTLALLPFPSLVRLGSTTEFPDTISKGGKRIECNTTQAIRNSANKKLMKECFSRAGVKTANWAVSNDKIALNNLKFPIVAKSLFGSRGRGNTKLDTFQQFESWIKGKDTSNYIFEEFVTMSREYRLHITSEGCFYTCRKLLKSDAPVGTWQRHDDVCSWALETNPSFKKPNNWNAIVEDCIKAQQSLGLDLCAFDVMVQGSKEGKERINPEWNICESCSAPSFGEVTGQKYIEIIPKILRIKYETKN